MLIFIAFLATSSVRCVAETDECPQTAAMEVYSNAFAHKETGDILGDELAIRRHKDASVEAFLYFYEGAPNKDGIRLSGSLSGKNLTAQGEWVEHLTEYPARKEIVERRRVRIDGVLESTSFKGVVTIDGLSDRDPVRLKRVKTIWLCRRRAAP